MKGYNCAQIMGNVTRDVECKVSQGGMEYANFSIAVNSVRKDRNTGEKIEDCTYIDVVAFGQTAKIAGNYLRKGSPVFIKGSLLVSTREHMDKTEKNYSVRVDELILLGNGQGRGQQGMGGMSNSGGFSGTGRNYREGAGSTSNSGGFSGTEQNYGEGEYANRPYPGSNSNSMPQSLREEFPIDFDGSGPDVEIPF